MLDVAIYEKDGKRHLHDHVAQITHISGNLVLDFITDFPKIMKGVHLNGY